MRSSGRRKFFRLAAGGTLVAVDSTHAVGPGVTRTSPDRTIEKLGFDAYAFSDGVYEHMVYSKGAGPVVIVMHELPGFDDHAANFVDRLVARGFCVHAPHLFGSMLWSTPNLNYLRLRCINAEFANLRANRSAPVCDWLRALARLLSEHSANPRIGVIGMCLTGAFVIPMVIEPGVGAGVISQPAIPFSVGYRMSGGTRGEGEWMREINVSDTDLGTASRRCARDSIPIIIQRFESDLLSPRDRALRIAEAFGDNATLDEYKNSGANEHPHALLTEEFDEALDVDPTDPTKPNSTRIALDKVVAFLHQNLDTQGRPI
ncbi:dienelactone hydrolase family protein [Caballeronia sp. LZ008]|uniref:dienelactone hydrolase family protein n=1 Tax=unclassified Caballeronia TaxID=2646786 RepID=UPI0020283F8B|nr:MULTISPECIES: dienelactone hydrolase family protein [unclassified Caballeronia]MDR5798222.1 dienelactone hydrolase family protein [Caballeronia sp. LZ008]